MRLKTNNVVIAFAGGTGGHFVLQVCSHILYNTDILIEPDGSCHNKAHVSDCVFVADMYPIDTSSFSLSAEDEYISSLDDHAFVIGHMRNIKALSTKAKVVYIDHKTTSPSQIYKILVKKTNGISYDAYQLLKGTDWPEYSSNLPDWVLTDIDEIILEHYDNWNWILPDQTDNVFCIPHNELLSGAWAESLCEFLEIDYASKAEYITQKTSAYRTHQ